MYRHRKATWTSPSLSPGDENHQQPTRSRTSTSITSTSYSFGNYQDDDLELDGFARPIRRIKSQKDNGNGGGGRRRARRIKILLLLLLLTSCLVIIVCISYLKVTNTRFISNDEFLTIQTSHVNNLSHANGSTVITTTIRPQAELPWRYHRDPFPQGDIGFDKNVGDRDIQVREIDLFRPFWDNEGCAQDWLVRGQICPSFNITNYRMSGTGSSLANASLWKDTRIDIVWTWVNGSDSRHRVSRRMYRERPKGRWADDSRDSDFFKEKLQLENFTLEREKSRQSQPHLHSRVEIIDNINMENSSNKKANNPILFPPPHQKTQAMKSDVNDERFRESDELRFSMRSAVKHLGKNGKLGVMHVVSPDYPAPRSAREEQEEVMQITEFLHAGAGTDQEKETEKAKAEAEFESGLKRTEFKFPSELSDDEFSDHFVSKEGEKVRLGQIPSWLNTSLEQVAIGDSASATAVDSPYKVRFHHDWNIFEANSVSRSSAEPYSNLRWKRETLPTFNSMSVELQLVNLGPTLTESFVYSNDDFFFGQDLSLSEFISPLYGLVFHFQPDLLVSSRKPNFASNQNHDSNSDPELNIYSSSLGSGEWPGLHHSNYLLDQRFGNKNRPYISHVQKSFSKPLLEEMNLIWFREIRKASENRWRGMVENDLINHFLFTHFIVERHREALLWSLIVAKSDIDGDGKLDKEELKNLLFDIGMTEKNYKRWIESKVNQKVNPLPILRVPVRLPERSTLLEGFISDNLNSIGYDELKQTRLKFSSHDGYPFIKLNPMVQTMSPIKNLAGGNGMIRIKEDKDWEPYPVFIPNEKTRYRFGEDLEMQDLYSRPNPNGLKGGKKQSNIHADEDSGAQGLPQHQHHQDTPDVKKEQEKDNERILKASQDLTKAACIIDLDDCFLRDLNLPDANLTHMIIGTEDIFKKVAFEKRNCGDCLILLGIRKSGEKGLSFFLPREKSLFPITTATTATTTTTTTTVENRNEAGEQEKSQAFFDQHSRNTNLGKDDLNMEPQTESKATSESKSEFRPHPRPPHLPLTKSSGSEIVSHKFDDDGEEIEMPDFSLTSISKSLGWESRSIREFSERLILRYTYSIGELPIRFVSLQTPVQAVNSFKELQRTPTSDPPALFCLNDDMGDRADRGFMKSIMHQFLDKEYPEPLEFEKDAEELRLERLSRELSL